MPTHPEQITDRHPNMAGFDGKDIGCAGSYVSAHAPSVLLTDYRRLVVIVPEEDVEPLKISRMIRSIRIPRQADILLVTLVEDADNEFSARRQLITITALVKDARSNISRRVVHQKSWVKLLAALLVAGDLLVCPAEISIPAGFFRREPLYAAILRTLDVPALIIPGFIEKTPHQKLSYLRQFSSYMFTMIFLCGFLRAAHNKY